MDKSQGEFTLLSKNAVRRSENRGSSQSCEGRGRSGRSPEESGHRNKNKSKTRSPRFLAEHAAVEPGGLGAQTLDLRTVQSPGTQLRDRKLTLHEPDITGDRASAGGTVRVQGHPRARAPSEAEPPGPVVATAHVLDALLSGSGTGALANTSGAVTSGFPTTTRQSRYQPSTFHKSRPHDGNGKA